MHPDLLIISLFSVQILANLVVAAWFVHEVCVLKIKIQDNKRDIDNLGIIVRRNEVTLKGQITRFITEISTKLRDANFTYPE